MIADHLHEITEKLPQAVRLVAVSKFHPVEALREAYDAGQRIFAESRPQELAAKVPQLPADIEWHFIGHLQTNKLKLVLPYVSLVQSVDSLHLLEAIDKWGSENDRVIPVLLELHLGAEETKQGFTAGEIRDILLRYCGTVPSETPPDLRNVQLCGLMGMATNTDDEALIEADFCRIESLFHALRAEFPSLASFTELSIGMSADWPIAIRHGATMVRIGTDIFGPREY